MVTAGGSWTAPLSFVRHSATMPVTYHSQSVKPGYLPLQKLKGLWLFLLMRVKVIPLGHIQTWAGPQGWLSTDHTCPPRFPSLCHGDGWGSPLGKGQRLNGTQQQEKHAFLNIQLVSPFQAAKTLLVPLRGLGACPGTSYSLQKTA